MEKYDLKKHGVTQGLLAMFMRCRQETALWMQGLEPMRTSQGLQFGTIAHIVLETVYGAKRKGPPSREEIFKALERARTLYLQERNGRLSADEAGFMEMNLALLEVIMPSYFVHHKKDFEKVRWAELEKRFVTPSPIPGINLTGRKDGAFWLGKELWLRENKTKSRIEEDVLSDTLSFDFQTSLYLYSLWKDYQVWPKGVLYDIIRRPGEKRKAGESLLLFKNRVAARIKLEPEFYFIRYEISIPKSEYSRFVGELGQIVQEFKDWTDKKLATYRNTSSCLQRFGPCRFLPICAQGEYALYRKRTELFPELAR